MKKQEEDAVRLEGVATVIHPCSCCLAGQTNAIALRHVLVTRYVS